MVVVVVVIHRTDFRHASVGQGLDLQNILRLSYDNAKVTIDFNNATDYGWSLSVSGKQDDVPGDW